MRPSVSSPLEKKLEGKSATVPDSRLAPMSRKWDNTLVICAGGTAGLILWLLCAISLILLKVPISETMKIMVPALFAFACGGIGWIVNKAIQ